MDKKGFTLIELLITVAIIGILAAIAVPAYVGMQKKARRSEAFTNLQNLALLESQFFADNGCYYSTGGVCTNSTFTTVGSIQAFLPRFQPGSVAALNYNYSITIGGSGASSAVTFTATAKGKTGTSVAGDTFMLDSSNIKTGW